MLVVAKKIFLLKVKIIVAVAPLVDLIIKNSFIKNILINPKQMKSNLFL